MKLEISFVRKRIFNANFNGRISRFAKLRRATVRLFYLCHRQLSRPTLRSVLSRIRILLSARSSTDCGHNNYNISVKPITTLYYGSVRNFSIFQSDKRQWTFSVCQNWTEKRHTLLIYNFIPVVFSETSCFSFCLKEKVKRENSLIRAPVLITITKEYLFGISMKRV